MLKTQKWVPDTHEAEFITQWDSENPDLPHVCIAATIQGALHPEPQRAYEEVAEQNRTKNRVLHTVLSHIPDHMKKPFLDSDGDPTGEFVVKDKHQPVWSLDHATGKVTVRVPGAPSDLVSFLHQRVVETHGDKGEVLPHGGE